MVYGYIKGDGLGVEIVGIFVLVYIVFFVIDVKWNVCDFYVFVSIYFIFVYGF